MNRYFFYILIITTLFFSIIMKVDPSFAEFSGQLVITGSDSVEPLVSNLAKGFMKNNKNVNIIVRSGESGKGIYDLRSGSASIGMVSRMLNSQESLDLRTFTIAYDGICFITSKNNPIKDISIAQLKNIYLGKITNWRSLGGNDLSISSLIHYGASSSNKIVAGFFGIKENDLKGTVINDYEAGIRAVARDPKAIYFVSTGEAFSEKLGGMPINIVSISGHKASMKNISQNKYPLTRPFNLVTKGEPTPLASAFISYCQSKAAAYTIRANYLIKPE